MEMVDAETPKANVKETDSKSGKKAVIIFLSPCGPSNINLRYLHMD